MLYNLKSFKNLYQPLLPLAYIASTTSTASIASIASTASVTTQPLPLTSRVCQTPSGCFRDADIIHPDVLQDAKNAERFPLLF